MRGSVSVPISHPTERWRERGNVFARDVGVLFQPRRTGGPGLKCWPLCWEEQSFREGGKSPSRESARGWDLTVSSDAGKEIVGHVLIYRSPVSPGQTHGCSVNVGWPTARCLGSTTPDTRMFRKHLLCSCACGFHRDAPKRLKPGAAASKAKCPLRSCGTHAAHRPQQEKGVLSARRAV